MKTLKHIVFDFDGVLANSNGLKNRAFCSVLQYFNLANISEFLSWNKQNGGITALDKFSYYITVINKDCAINAQTLEQKFREIVNADLMQCEPDYFIPQLSKFTSNSIHSIISGGNELEIKNYLNARQISASFNGAVLGNPLSKYDNFKKIEYLYPVSERKFYLGDSKLDYELSEYFDYEFIFITKWSDFLEWEKYFSQTSVRCVESIHQAFDYIYR